jgi:hypothetical protein
MEESPLSQHSLRGCFIVLISLVFVTGAMALSGNYVYLEHPLCRGAIGGGFPFLFVCDANTGGSPISSWGKVTFIDILMGGLRPGGFLLDFLFYLILACVIWFAAGRLFHTHLHRRDLLWAACMSVIYISGLLCGSLVFFSSELYDKGYARTPTENPIIVPSTTPFGTPPSLITPIPTARP